MIDKKLCKSIKALRLHNNLTVKEFAESLGISSVAIYKIEAAERNPSIELLTNIAIKYKLKLSILLC